MIPKSLVSAVLPLLFSCILMAGSFQTFAASEEERTAFNQVYQEYQEIVAGNGEAERLMDVAEEVYRLGAIVFGEDHANTAVLSLNYARSLTGDPAIEALEEALERYENSFGEGAVDLIDPYMELAQTNGSLGNMAEAKQYYLNALELVEEHFDNGSQLEGLINMSIGIVDTGSTVGFQDREDHEEQTLAYLEDAREIFSALDDRQSGLYLAQTNFALGNYQIRLLDFEEAVDTLLAALNSFSAVSTTDEITVNTHISLIHAYERLGQRDDATRHCLAIAVARPYDSEQDYLPVYSLPAYPPQRSIQGGGPLARRSRAEGFTRLTFSVDNEGFVRDPEVLESEGSSLFPGESLRVIREFRYAPRLVNGEAVDTPNVEYRFTHTPAPGFRR